ncbi:hypothetical protein J5N97_012530 [Dioscorea zingiberensis]|uniref:Polygalacturonase n=1 Tax=Dioscorea zingiberensis TaxID=325984 RepID=A0A9D5HHT6_9LILI|nr:hypothetical protein J5N97_012530 [Dioscorea zingiberensis]
MDIFASTAVTVQGVNITAPEESPNTDGIHVHQSDNVTVTDSSMHTGDDCISIGAGTTNVLIQRVSCGPGHGISIGSLGGGTTDVAGVKNIMVRNITFVGSQNGIRIKTWAKPNSGFVTDVVFQHITMNAVDNPILVDQNYCPGNRNCPNMTSGIAISNVSYTDITGTSTTPVAVKFDCSPTRPCNGISLEDVLLLYENRPALSFCRNVNGTAAGYVVPESCLN